jgi:GTPase
VSKPAKSTAESQALTKTKAPKLGSAPGQAKVDAKAKVHVKAKVDAKAKAHVKAPTKPLAPSPAPAAAPVMPAMPAHPRCGFIAIIGAPNAGKSTLVNTIVGTKVTIVSHKVQTTRMQVRGIAMNGDAQLVFIDTPGIFKPRRRLDRAMVKAAWGGAQDADVVVLLFDAQRDIAADTDEMLARIGQSKGRRVLALNKIDEVPKEKLLALATAFNERAPFEATFMISALKGAGVKDLTAYLAANAPLGPWHYNADDVTDMPLRLLASEITREKLFNRLHEELPYATTVETTAWKDMGKKGIRIEQTIYVERDSQRSIVLGEAGRTIKNISMGARKELAGIVERDVHLFLHVKVKDGWEHDPERYRDMGLEFPKD